MTSLTQQHKHSTEPLWTELYAVFTVAGEPLRFGLVELYSTYSTSTDLPSSLHRSRAAGSAQSYNV